MGPAKKVAMRPAELDRTLDLRQGASSGAVANEPDMPDGRRVYSEVLDRVWVKHQSWDAEKSGSGPNQWSRSVVKVSRERSQKIECVGGSTLPVGLGSSSGTLGAMWQTKRGKTKGNPKGVWA